MLNKCGKEQQTILKETYEGNLIDREEPDCRRDGSYKAEQCNYEPFRRCWCVNRESGEYIYGTDHRLHQDFNCRRKS